jgi:murein DD-endopeptidase MepM/ murein hydrolase activator NlpD
VLALAAVAALAVADAAPASPASLPAKQEELRRVQERLDSQRQRLERNLRRERRLSNDIQRLDREREAAEARLARLAVELRRTRQRSEAAAVGLARAEAALARHHALLAQRLVEAHRYGRAGYLDVVLGAASFSEFVARTRFVGAVLGENTRLVHAYTADRNKAARLRTELEQHQARLQELLQETEERERYLARQSAAKREMLERVVRERASAEHAVQDLEDDSAALEALIQRLQGAGARVVERTTTAFLWPLRGPVTSRFGIRPHPLFRRRHFHSGVDISAPRGTPVMAAMAGTVMFTGWYGGYGKLVVLDHGNGVSTLYGHLSAILVRPGQRVGRGQVIGRVGTTGYTTGPHLHYEIRQNGRPVDPLR